MSRLLCAANLVCSVQVGFAVVLPAATVLLSAAGLLLSRSNLIARTFGDFITPEDVEADEALDAALAGTPDAATNGRGAEDHADASERTPLLANYPDEVPVNKFKRTPRSWAFVGIGLGEAAMHATALTRLVTLGAAGDALIIPSILLAVWAYATLLPIIRPPRTAPLALLSIYMWSAVAVLLDIYIALIPPGMRGGWDISVVAHGSLCALGIVLVWGMPMLVTRGAPVLGAALDDTATLGQWTTFSWISPLIARGKLGTLEDADVSQLSRTLRARPLLRAFSSEDSRPQGIITRLLLANMKDMILITLCEIVQALLTFAQPYLLQRLLVAITARDAMQSTKFSSSPALNRDAVIHFLASDLGLRGVPHSEERINPTQAAYLYACLAFICTLVKGQLEAQWSYLECRGTLRARSEVVASIYEKALKRVDTTGAIDPADKAATPSSSAQNTDTGKQSKDSSLPKPRATADLGKIISLISTDAGRLNNFLSFYTFMAQTPLTITIAAIFLYSLLGYSAFVGYAVMLVAIPANAYGVKQQMRVVKVWLEMRDRRTSSINQLIQNIKFIKFSAWETRWIARVIALRETELKWLVKFKLLIFAVGFIWDVVPILTACISLAWFTVVAHGQLSVSIAFPALLAFQILSAELTLLPQSINQLTNVYVSVQRIGAFLKEKEVPAWVSSLRADDAPPAPFAARLGALHATFRWHALPVDTSPAAKPKSRWLPRLWRGKNAADVPDILQADDIAQEPFELRDINVIFPRGKMSLVYGPTGSGKSSLLSALLGEMSCVEGSVLLPKYAARVDVESGRIEGVSFCAQQPWLEHQTIRENILFGTPYEKERYDAVLEACALVQDLTIFEDGDETEIGEKGISLSGGQKARVALARAVYAQNQTILLDDVLSAVDTHTADALVQRCFRGPLMRGRTVVLVTHHVEAVLTSCAWAVRMSDGVIAAQGTLADMRNRGELETAVANAVEKDIPVVNSGGNTGKTPDKDVKKLVEKEEKRSGNVSTQFYMTYIHASGVWIVGLLAAAILVQRSGDLVQKIWIKIWSESYDVPLDAPERDRYSRPFHFPPAYEHVMPYVLVYLGIQLANAIVALAVQFPTIYSSLRASRTMFNGMLESVVRSPSRWFDKTPSGRILNRFSSDISAIDFGLSRTVQDVFSKLLSIAVALATIMYGIPPFLVVAVVLVYLHAYVANGYIKSSRDLNRITATRRSPIVSAFGELLVGVATIRAFSAERRFMETLFKRLDQSQETNFYNSMTGIWLHIRFQVLASLALLGTTLIVLALDVNPGLAAIVITQAQGIVQTIYWGLRGYVEAEQSFNSVERIAEYIELPPEPPRVTDTRPPANWPAAETGGVTFKDVTIKYAPELEAVLKSVSFEIKPREKIGLVGRTGSGKSTLALSLFRFVDPEQGRISVDGIDITTIGVEDLRSRLTLIPQDAALFTGTVRDNLDPFAEHTDAECLDVLRRVQLLFDGNEEPALSTPSPNRPGSATPIGTGASTPSAAGPKKLVTLDSEVSSGGNNWSAGQRQLIAMAYAFSLLRRTSIIVLDESTASVDFETDRKIQETIRDGFRDNILVTIAHRLQTIIDYDRILVLDHGEVVEFDTPANLFAKDGGYFRAMCLKSDNFDALQEIVQKQTASRT